MIDTAVITTERGRITSIVLAHLYIEESRAIRFVRNKLRTN